MPNLAPNEKVHKFDGDYTKWNAIWQAFTVLVDRNPKLPKVTKFNRLNATVEGEAHQIISMFEFDQDLYELAKMAVIAENGDPGPWSKQDVKGPQKHKAHQGGRY